MNRSLNRTEAIPETPAERVRVGLARRLLVWRARRVIAAALRDLGPITTVLDIPCAHGRLVPVLNRYHLHTLLVDLSPTMILEVMAANRARDRILQGVVASAFRLPLADESVDAVLCSRFLNRLPLVEDRITVLRELGRVCRVGAVVSFYDAASFRHRRRLRKGRRSDHGRWALLRSEFKYEASRAGFKCLAMHALLRFHSELTAAALIKQDLPDVKSGLTVSPTETTARS